MRPSPSSRTIATQKFKSTIGYRLPGGGGWCHPQTVFPELLENAKSQRAELAAMLLYIQGGPDDILKILGQVRSLTYDVILKPLHGPR